MIIKNLLNYSPKRFVVNVPPTASGKRRFRLEVEKDPHKLVNYCCGINYHIDEPLKKLDDDDKYPDWLWELRLGPKLPSHLLQKGTKEYYERQKEENLTLQYNVRMRSKLGSKIVGRNLLDHQDYLHQIRFRALAFMEDDAGMAGDALEEQTFPEKETINARDYYLPMTNKVLYKDKIPGNLYLKNFLRGDPDRRGEPRIVEHKYRKATQDSRRRHPHSVF